MGKQSKLQWKMCGKEEEIAHLSIALHLFLVSSVMIIKEPAAHSCKGGAGMRASL